MAFLIGGANSAADTGYDVDNSCRLNDTSSAYLHKTPGSTGVEEKFTFSAWLKFNNEASANQCLLFIEGDNGSDDYVEIAFKPELDIQYNNGTYSQYVTNMKFRDPSAWFHFCLGVDTTQSVAGNRHKLYINGTQITSFSTETAIPQNDVLQSNTSGKKMWLGAHYNGPKNFWDGYMAEVFWIDGTQYAASDFGEFNSDSPTIWQPKDCSGDLTFGTNGFYLDFEDSSNLGNDANGGTDLTEVNLAATDQSTDTCTNNFCTLNPLYNQYADPTYSEGNLKITAGSGWAGAKATMGVSAGKWYWELKLSGTMSSHQHGVQQENVNEGAQNPQNTTGSTSFYNHDGGEINTDGSNTSADYGTLDDGDILGIALDMDAGSYGQITFYDNGSAIASNINLSSSSTTVMPHFSIDNSTVECNFGNPPYANSSDAADENGYGAFEYAPPSGHLALCTKNLATDG